MASTEILSQTLSTITSIKLDQLRKQKEAYETKKHTLLRDVALETDSRKRATSLLKGAAKLPSMAANPRLSAANLKRFVEQAAYDPSVSEAFLHDYEAALRNELQVQSNKFDFATLYGRLVNEWIASGKGSGDAAEYVSVGRDESHEQRAVWEAYVFKAKDTDSEAIRAYLDGVFTDSSKDVKRSLDSLRDSMKEFQKEWDGPERHFDDEVLTDCLKGMLRVDLLSDEKRATLRGFLGNKVVLSEIADVLNMRMSTRSSWAWDAPLVVQQRRNLNGRYRFYPDEDLLHSIFVWYVGQRWAVQVRTELVRFFEAKGVWKSNTKPISKADDRRRRYFLGAAGIAEAGSMQSNRDNHFAEDIMLDQMPKSMVEVRGVYGEDKNAEEDTRASHVDVVQQLLHRIESEILIQTNLGKDVTVIRSDFKWFGPSIPHSSIFAVLDFFGVNDEWKDFFRRVLAAPLRFEQDPPDSPVQYRRRGTPLSTPVADFFGETLLFCMDFAVNQKADGARLYRLHDDMWLWGEDDTCAKAWSVMSQFSKIVGLDFNETKTGSARILGSRAAAAPTSTAKPAGSLPSGDVTWGFLRLDSLTGRFLIDQKQVDRHIEELRLQLAACRTVFDWIQAWNIYGSRFFSTNFGRPANCYSRAHVDSMLTTFRRIQERLFPKHSGGVGDYLKAMIASRFGLAPGDIPDGYIYFPSSLGGLGLLNPFIPLLLIRDQVSEDPAKIMDEYRDKEEFEYRRTKERFESPSTTWRHDKPDFKELRDEPFMSFDEFVRYRERTSAALGRAYEAMMQEPRAVAVDLKGDVKAAVGGDIEWTSLSGYEQWVVQLFHKDMMARFGGLGIVDEGLLPTGLMTMLRQSRFQWQG